MLVINTGAQPVNEILGGIARLLQVFGTGCSTCSVLEYFHDCQVLMQADVNVALTAMSLLWNAADLLSRMHQQAEERGNSTQVLSPEDFEDLLRLLLGSLQVLLCSIQ